MNEVDEYYFLIIRGSDSWSPRTHSICDGTISIDGIDVEGGNTSNVYDEYVLYICHKQICPYYYVDYFKILL